MKPYRWDHDARALSSLCIINKTEKNSKSSTDAELVSVNAVMGKVLWTRLFLEAQRHVVNSNIVFQDNKSEILLEENGKMGRHHQASGVKDIWRSDFL